MSLQHDSSFGGEWRNIGKGADDAMPFRDGVPNLLKYAFKLNTRAADATTMTALGNKGLPLIGNTYIPGPAQRTRFAR